MEWRKGERKRMKEGGMEEGRQEENEGWKEGERKEGK